MDIKLLFEKVVHRRVEVEGLTEVWVIDIACTCDGHPVSIAYAMIVNMKSIESPLPQEEEQGTENEDQNIVNLWEKYSFPETPPPLDSVEGQRLLDYCRSYIEYALTNKLPSPPMYDSENMRASIIVDNWADRRRRELHNNIALIVAGKDRSSMGDWEAGEIANFASELVLGEDLESARKHKEKYKE